LEKGKEYVVILFPSLITPACQGLLKKAVQQGRRVFGARSVHEVREDDKGPRTQLAAFFNSP